MTELMKSRLNLLRSERTFKKMTCVQIESVHIDGFKNAIKNSKSYPVAMLTGNFGKRGKKCLYAGQNISR